MDPITEDRVLLVVGRAVDEGLERFESRLLAHVDERVQTITETFTGAFPNGDISGHRAAHEIMMDEARRCKSVREQVVGHVVTWGLIATIGWLFIVAWRAIQESVS